MIGLILQVAYTMVGEVSLGQEDFICSGCLVKWDVLEKVDLYIGAEQCIGFTFITIQSNAVSISCRAEFS